MTYHQCQPARHKQRKPYKSSDKQFQVIVNVQVGHHKFTFTQRDQVKSKEGLCASTCPLLNLVLPTGSSTR